jgi:type III restriction enzyme
LQQDYVDDYGYRFGAVPPETFARIQLQGPDGLEASAGREHSKRLFKHLVDSGFLNDDGQLTEKCRPSDPSFRLDVPEDWQDATAQVIDRLKRSDLRSRIKNARDRQSITYNKRVALDEPFQELWQRISQRTRYRVEFSSDELIDDAVRRIQEASPIRPLRVRIEKVAIDLEEGGVRAERVLDTASRYTDRPATLPDILGTLQNETQMTRRSLVKILLRSGRLEGFSINPQAFVSMSAECINKAMRAIMLTGIAYEKIAESFWEMRRLEEEAERGITRYLSNLYKVQHEEKSIYDYVNFESDVERKFAEELDNHECVELFVKLPSWFTIDTPVGTYNPDWALVTTGDRRLYFVRETKGTLDYEK